MIPTENKVNECIEAVNTSDTTGSKKKNGYLIAKRIFDFVSSLMATVIFLVPIIIIAAMIFIEDPGNPFYMQERVGQDGKPIKLLKFRSMKKGADQLEKHLTPEQIKEYKREYKLYDDPRLIGYKKKGDGMRCFGAFIRKYSIDEFPQIFYNILFVGDLSVVGPRPILRDELETKYNEAERQKFISVKPGLTGYWQAYARNGVGYDDHQRQDMELFYIDNRSAWFDIKIIFKTFISVIKCSGSN